MCLTGIKYDATIQNILIDFFSSQNIISFIYLKYDLGKFLTGFMRFTQLTKKRNCFNLLASGSIFLPLLFHSVFGSLC